MLVASTLPVAAVTFRQNSSAPGYTLDFSQNSQGTSASRTANTTEKTKLDLNQPQ
jgi:hypothetical protein